MELSCQQIPQSGQIHYEIAFIVKSRAVDWSTIQFWKVFANVHSKVSNFPCINILKMLGSATNQDLLLLMTLRYVFLTKFGFSSLFLFAVIHMVLTQFWKINWGYC